MVAMIALYLLTRPPGVVVVSPEKREVIETIAVSGRVQGQLESQLAPEITGTLEQILVEEGDLVEKGQLLARLNDKLLRAQLGQALKAVESAQAQLAQTARPPLVSEVARVQAETTRQVETARAELETARQRLSEARSGVTVEQMAQLEAQSREAQANAEQISRDYRRQRALFEEGAISRSQAEQALTEWSVAKERSQQAAARLQEARVGTRPEQLAQARAQVEAAQANLEGLSRSRQAQLQNLRDQPRVEDVALAEARLQEARKAAEVAREQVSRTELRTPYQAVVTRRLLREGDLASPSRPVFALASQPRLEVRAQIDESELPNLKIGQSAVVKNTAYPDSPFEAQVREVAGQVDPVTGTIEVRLDPRKSPDWLMVGQTVELNLIVAEQAPRLLIPLQAVMLQGELAKVRVVEENEIREVTVRLGAPTELGYPVFEGLEESSQVVLEPLQVEPGQRARPQGR